MLNAHHLVSLIWDIETTHIRSTAGSWVILLPVYDVGMREVLSWGTFSAQRTFSILKILSVLQSLKIAIIEVLIANRHVGSCLLLLQLSWVIRFYKMTVSMVMSSLLLMTNLQRAFLTSWYQIVLIHIASVEVARLESLLSFSAVLRLVHRMVRPASWPIVRIKLGATLMLWLHWPVLDSTNKVCKKWITYYKFFLLFWSPPVNLFCGWMPPLLLEWP